MDSFAFIIHPIDPKRDVSRKYPLLGRIFSERFINFGSTFFPPVYISEITGITSRATGKEIKGWFVACPFTAARMLQLPEKTVYRKIVQTGQLAERLGARILGLGAFTSVVGDAGVTIARQLDIPVTSGDAYTVAIAVRAIQDAARRLGIQPASARAAIVGAAGAIGSVCAEMLADEVQTLYLIGRDTRSLEKLCTAISARQPRARLEVHTSMEILRQADMVIAVSSALEAIIQPEHLAPGSVVCDVARPRDVSTRVAALREDVLVIDGGMVEVPGKVDFHFDFGFQAGKAYACMAETMALALEGRFEDYTLGKEISRQRVQEIDAIAAKHGFRLSGFRSFERPVTDGQIESIRAKGRLL